MKKITTTYRTFKIITEQKNKDGMYESFIFPFGKALHTLKASWNKKWLSIEHAKTIIDSRIELGYIREATKEQIDKHNKLYA